MRISDWSSDVCSSDLLDHALILVREDGGGDPPRGATPDDADATDGAGRAHCGIAARNCAWLGARATVSATLVRIFAIASSSPPLSIKSEERRVGKQVVSQLRSGWSPNN